MPKTSEKSTVILAIKNTDCTRPENWQDLIKAPIPKANQFNNDLFESCLIPDNLVNSNCSFSIDADTGLRQVGEENRIIIDEDYTKDVLPDGAKKYFNVQPNELCQVMLMNASPTDYTNYFDWKQ